MKKIIRLTENDLIRIVKRVISEQITAPQQQHSKALSSFDKTMKAKTSKPEIKAPQQFINFFNGANPNKVKINLTDGMMGKWVISGTNITLSYGLPVRRGPNQPAQQKLTNIVTLPAPTRNMTKTSGDWVYDRRGMIILQ